MAEDIEDILGKIAIRTGMPLDLNSPSPELVQFLAEMASYINTLAVATYGGRQGQVREEGLLQQVIGAALQTFAGVDPHPTAFDKAAMLLRGITAGHPFQDGNKRTGFLMSVFYLEQRGYPLPEELSTDRAEDLSLRVSSGELRDVHQIASELKRLWHHSD